jgi:hypothetical protein
VASRIDARDALRTALARRLTDAWVFWAAFEVDCRAPDIHVDVEPFALACP